MVNELLMSKQLLCNLLSYLFNFDATFFWEILIQILSYTCICTHKSFDFVCTVTVTQLV